MRLPFRDHHLLQFLESWKPSGSLTAAKEPIDRALHEYFRAHHALGSRDREAISTYIYQLVRWQRALHALNLEAQDQETRTQPSLDNPTSWKRCLELIQSGALEKVSQLPSALRFSMSDALYRWIVESLGEEQALLTCEILQESAPVFLRVNTLKTSRDQLLKLLPMDWNPRAGALDDSIIVEGRPSLFRSEWFREGYFEMQDEGSQILASLVQAQSGDQILDYCAGSGGKSLAIAPKLKGKGQLFLHDVRTKALGEARQRLRRAGIQNAQVLTADHPQLKKLKKQCQWVLVDAPCSGSGTLRRNPDMKERIDEAFIQHLVSLQRSIFEKALSFLAEGGKIIYATCSLLNQENSDQVAHFLQTYPLELVEPALQLLPERGGHDGFFAAIFRKKKREKTVPTSTEETVTDAGAERT